MSRAKAKQGEKESRSNPSRIQVEIWMLQNGLRHRDIARALGVVDSYISNYLAGRQTSVRIREYLAGLGCPISALDGLRQGGRK